MSSPIDPPAAANVEGVQRSRSRWTLRGELLASHLGLATLIVFGFGLAMFATTYRAVYRQAEADLLGAAQLLVQDLADGRDPASLAISDAYQHRFGKAPRDHAYFAVWDARGRLIAGTSPLPAEVAPAEQAPPTEGPHPFSTRAYGTHLDVIVAAPHGGQLLIGRPLAKEFDGVLRLLRDLGVTAIGCLAVGAVGAWWLANRLAEPIGRIADAAERITSRNLSQRLEAAAGPVETARLAGAFNSMLDRLHEAFAQQVRFTADASHELRTPTAVVLSQTEHTLARERRPEDYRLALETCRAAALRMKKLVDDLLLLARADSGRLDLRTEPLDLAELTRETVSLLAPLAASRDVQIETDAGSTPLSGDPHRLRQVLTNLITNAVLYNAPGGSVTVSTKLAESHAVLIVQDDGPGIPLADQPRLFERFYRVDQARTHTEEAGSGLGLSVVAEIVAAHGGTIEVQSTPGAGATFTVRIPIARSDRGLTPG
ncbi:MAG TPA: ATP-binding protein [Pirellulales bacterium]